MLCITFRISLVVIKHARGKLDANMPQHSSVVSSERFQFVHQMSQKAFWSPFGAAIFLITNNRINYHYQNTKKISERYKVICLNMSPLSHSCSKTTYHYMLLHTFLAHSKNCEKGLSASPCLSVRLHGTTWLPLEIFSWNLVSEYFSKLCRQN
jgi:hypothetical protein